MFLCHAHAAKHEQLPKQVLHGRVCLQTVQVLRQLSRQASIRALQMLEVQQQPDRDPEVDHTGEALIPSSRRSFSYADSASDKDLSLRTGHPHQLTSADDRAISIAPRLRSTGVEGRQSNMHTPDLADEALFQEALQAATGEAQLRVHVPAGGPLQWLPSGVPSWAHPEVGHS